MCGEHLRAGEPKAVPRAQRAGGQHHAGQGDPQSRDVGHHVGGVGEEGQRPEGQAPGHLHDEEGTVEGQRPPEGSPLARASRFHGMVEVVTVRHVRPAVEANTTAMCSW